MTDSSTDSLDSSTDSSWIPWILVVDTVEPTSVSSSVLVLPGVLCSDSEVDGVMVGTQDYYYLDILT